VTTTRRTQVRNRDALLSVGLADLRTAVIDVLEAGLEASDPALAVDRRLSFDGTTLSADGRAYPVGGRGVMVLGAGKASLRIAVALEAMLGDCIDAGLVVVPRGQAGRLDRIEVIEADHPLPSADSVTAARRLLALAGTARPGDLVICCFTGGSSALASLPPRGVDAEQKRTLHRLLLQSGASIAEINCVRKHVSSFKGGRLAVALADATILNLTVSDVAGDPLDAITDPTVPDTTTVADAVAVLERHGLWEAVPAPVRAHLEDAATAESPKLDGSGIATLMLVSGELACTAMAERATQRGYSPVVLSTSIEGESREVGATLVSLARESHTRGRPFPPPCMLVGCGGETTVTVTNGAQFGTGGPNQEAAIGAALRLKPDERIVAAFVDTDGSDGGTDAAGALVDGTTARRAEAAGVDLRAAILDHSSRDALQRIGELLVTGPTGTNVNDMFAIAVDLAEES
jgi:glycerate-2-kinase